jgi:PilZ domain
MDCRVVASAGAYVLLKLGRGQWDSPPAGACSLTYLDGMTPMGLDGDVEPGAHEGEIRFRLISTGSADRRSSVRLPVMAPVTLTKGGESQPARLLDVSAGGMRFVHGAGKHELGEVVRVEVHLPDGPFVAADAVVRASEAQISSVEFTMLHHGTPQEIGAWTVARLRSSLAGQG